jgi:glycosyltransferase involved in cell wall biosynthesis
MPRTLQAEFEGPAAIAKSGCTERDQIMKMALFLPCWSNKFGGAERRFFYLFTRLANEGDGCFLITNRSAYETGCGICEDIDSVKEKILICDTIHTSWIEQFVKANKIYFIINSIMMLMRKKIEHIHHPTNVSWYGLVLTLFRRQLGISISYSIVGSIYKSRKDIGFFSYYMWIYCLRRSVWIDCLSESIRKDLIRIFSDAHIDNKISVAPCSFSLIADRSETKSSELLNVTYASRPIDIVFISRLVEKKGVPLLISVLKEFERFGRMANVRVCGQGPLTQSIRKALGTCEYIDWNVEYSDNTYDVISQSKIILSLQEEENYPSQVLLEAAGAYTVAIATDVGDTSFLVDNDCGVLVVGDPKIIAKEILNLLANPELMASKAEIFHKRVVENHSITKFCPYFLEKVDKSVADSF